MEVHDNSGQDGPLEIQSTQAQKGQSYPIRLINYQNGMMIIGFVISVFPETTMVLRPYVVEVNFNPETDNVDGYEFTPYLDQLVFYDPLDLQPVPFMNSTMISMVKPAQHMVQNFMFVIRTREMLAITSDEDQNSLSLFSKINYPSINTRH